MNRDYKALLDQVIAHYFPSEDFDLLGKLEWHPVTEREQERYFKKTGEQLNQQRRRYIIKTVFEVKHTKKGGVGQYGTHHYLLISDVEENGLFYCVDDDCFGGMAGQKIRYTFKCNDVDIQEGGVTGVPELIETTMIAIR